MPLLLARFATILLVIPHAFQFADGVGVRFSPVHNASKVGVVDVYSIPEAALPAHCTDFATACRLEATGRMEEAFELYESRYAACGDYGWRIKGHKAGNYASATFKLTPCGLGAVVKGSRIPFAMEHIQRECEVMKVLNAAQVADCPGCFPKYFYYSNHTRACYSQLLRNPVPVGVLAWRLGRTQNNVVAFGNIVCAAMRMVHVLRQYGIEHRDITLRNIMFLTHGSKATNAGGGALTDSAQHLAQVLPAVPNLVGSEYALVFIDFGASRYLWEDAAGLHVSGNQGRSDVFTIACQFYFFKYFHKCHEGPVRAFVESATGNVTATLQYALLRVMLAHLDAGVTPDFGAIDAQLASAKSF